jgi:glycosyltransferase involved in cell wall biosynthesis
MRICRVMGTYPTDIRPGMGLPEYYMFVHMADPSLGIARLRRDRPLPPPDNVRLLRLPYPDAAISNASGGRRLWALVFKTIGYITFWLLSLPYMIRFRPRIIHIHSPMPMLHGLFGKYVLGAKFFITFHGTDVNHLPRSRILRALVRRADMVCYVSTAMQKAIEDAVPPERLLYTPNGVDTAAFPPGNDDRAQRVLMVGSLRWQKGYPDALAAFAKFKEHRPDWGLDIVGVGPLGEELETLARELNPEGSVRFLGMRSREQVAKLMRESKLFLLSSVSEGFPKVLLEAAASGLPIVTTDVGSCRDLVEDGVGIAVQAGDSEAIATALESMAADEKLWRSSARRGPDVAKEHSWGATAKVLHEAYVEALSR